jgi:hypothetical protein
MRLFTFSSTFHLSIQSFTFVFLSLLVSGCFHDSNGNNHNSSNSSPIAEIDTAPTEGVILGSVIFVDGGGSSDPEGDNLAFAWSLLESPPASTTELNDPSDPISSFTPDEAGNYEIQLIVNDGKLDSKPAIELISVIRPAPTVTITSPENNAIFATSLVGVTGTVDDPDASVTVNGVQVANESGSYETQLTLQEGGNLITVVATNDAGEGTAETNAVVNTTDNPVIVITSPRQDFVAGPALDSSPGPNATTIVNVRGFVKVNTLKIGPGANLPAVWINGQPAASVERDIVSCLLQAGSLDLCYRFTGTLMVGLVTSLTITVDAEDVEKRMSSASVAGYVDYCIKGNSDGLAYYQVDAGGRQNNRCHEIDGCSLYLGQNDQITQVFRNDPAAALTFPQLHNQSSTEFGSGEAPPEEFYIHGNRPARSLPCNLHDQCYQTAGSSQAVCDFREMYVGTDTVCRAAYPATCPYTGLQIVLCPDWFFEKAACYDAANIYYLGDVAAGEEAHTTRQEEYTSAQ